MEYLQEVYLDMNPNNSYVVVSAKQYDADSRGIIAHLTKDGQAYQVTGNKVVFRMKKPDGHIVINDAIINNNGTITTFFTQQCLIVDGRAYADLAELDDEDRILSTVSFIIDIKPSPNPGQVEIKSMDDYPIIYNFVENAQKVIDSVQEWANGYHGSEPVDESSPAYNNNAKYWAYRSKNVADTMDFSINSDTGNLILSYEEP